MIRENPKEYFLGMCFSKRKGESAESEKFSKKCCNTRGNVLDKQ